MSPVFISLIVRQLIAHFLADFIFQKDSLAKKKDEEGLHSRTIYYHACYVTIFSFIFAFTLDFWFYSIIIGVSHLLIDGIKSGIDPERKFWRNKPFIKIKKKLLLEIFSKKGYILFLDQLAHITILYFVVQYYLGTTISIESFYYQINDLLSNNKLILYLFGYLLCMKPSNIVIKIAVNRWINPDVQKSIGIEESQSLLNAGKLIGNAERILTLTLILLSQYTALGFLIAAKSILRFKDTEPKKSEYMLIGTLLSFGIAVMIGVLLKLIVHSLAL